MKTLALTTDGRLTQCSVPPEKRGIGRCNHVSHQEQGESVEQFINRVNDQISDDSNDKAINTEKHITKDDIKDIQAQIDEIAGCHLTQKNMFEVLAKLDPEKSRQIQSLAIKQAENFGVPITDKKDIVQADIENKIYFADFVQYGIAGKGNSLTQMFDAIGSVPSADGTIDINNNYRNGLTPSERFEKIFSSRAADIAKTVSVAEPGYEAKLMFSGISDLVLETDCGSKRRIGILDCKVPGGICKHCLDKALKVEGINNVDWKPGEMIGGHIATHATEPLTQVSMKFKHTGGVGLDKDSKAQRDIFKNTYRAYGSSPIVQAIRNAKTTKEARIAAYEGLKQACKDNSVKIDDYNLAIIAKRLTSYKNDKGKLRYVEDGEKCDVVSFGRIGNSKNPLKSALAETPYKHLSKPIKITIPPDAEFDMSTIDIPLSEN